MLSPTAIARSLRGLIFLIICGVLLSNCYSYRIATHAQPGTEFQTRTAHSFFWGLVQNPKEISTPICDSLHANGVSIVQVQSNFGYSLITVLTLGIWSPMKIQWKCSKPCQVSGHL
ncbi:MAG TPA: hypothetical protein VNW04_20340 [Puia sp.]|jgi:hypothetical protein|nr:hypothetical protein [Puia sp.]